MFLDRQDDPRLPVHRSGPVGDSGADAHLGYVVDQNRNAVPGRYYGYPDVLHACGTHHASNQDFATARPVDAACYVLAGPFDGVEYVVKTHLVGQQSLRIDQNLVLAHFAALHYYLRHPWHGQQPPPYDPVRRSARLHELRFGSDETDKHDLAHDRGDGGEHRRTHSFGQSKRLGLEPGAHDLPREIDVGSPFEIGPDDADSLGGFRAHPADSERAVKGRFDREGDRCLNVFRSHPVGVGHYCDSGGGQIGKYIDREGGSHPAPDHK